MERTYQLRTLQRNHRLTLGREWRVRSAKGVNDGSTYGIADCGAFVSGGTRNDDPVACPKCEAIKQ
jgi:hypothetical protein